MVSSIKPPLSYSLMMPHFLRDNVPFESNMSLIFLGYVASLELSSKGDVFVHQLILSLHLVFATLHTCNPLLSVMFKPPNGVKSIPWPEANHRFVLFYLLNPSLRFGLVPPCCVNANNVHNFLVEWLLKKAICNQKLKGWVVSWLMSCTILHQFRMEILAGKFSLLTS